MSDINKIIQEESHIRKFDGIVPEGFIMVHEKTIEDLKNFEIWKDWKNGITSINDLNKSNFQDK